MSETVYLIALQNDKYYVGKTKNFVRRMDEHIDGEGAKWVKKHGPLVSQSVVGNFTGDAEWHESGK